ncbi:MAG: hypothetical protein HUU34_00715 [Saprospiraceae bacterium]|jgi:hypothetical protein|nr:hypothetical protein [Saprospiraceae bacterium]
MVQTITIDIINEKAIRLLEDLEHLQLIRLHRDHVKGIDANLAARYKGAMTKQPLNEVDEQLDDLRNGWE